jgi:hypothetical protein
LVQCFAEAPSQPFLRPPACMKFAQSTPLDCPPPYLNLYQCRLITRSYLFLAWVALPSTHHLLCQNLLGVPHSYPFVYEIDQHVRALLRTVASPEHVYTDVRRAYRRKHQAVHVFAAGFPCQPFATSGLRKASCWYHVPLHLRTACDFVWKLSLQSPMWRASPSGERPIQNYAACREQRVALNIFCFLQNICCSAGFRYCAVV